MKKITSIVLYLCLFSTLSKAQSSMYFPPITGTTWETTTPQSLGWCSTNIDSLYSFLNTSNTKAFIVLKNGRMVLEKYFGTFTQDSAWYWASAGKTLTGFLAGVAQKEGLININDPTSKYLGTGWTSTPSVKEALITVKHQLTMSTGLDDGVPDDNCTKASCLIYKADAGTRWAYHNAPYHLVEDIIAKTSGMSFTQYTLQKLQKTGLSGLWLDYVFYSKPRSMARFGLLLLNKGIWNQDTILKDSLYFKSMINTSQNYNKSYGYLTWLNGKGSYILPQSQVVFPNNLVPSAPNDMYCALGKNDQKIYVVPSQNLVVIRMGNASGTPLYALSNFDNELWKRLSALNCSTTATTENANNSPLSIYPNPSQGNITITLPDPTMDFKITIYDVQGRILKTTQNESSIQLSNAQKGLYFLKYETGDKIITQKFIIN